MDHPVIRTILLVDIQAGVADVDPLLAFEYMQAGSECEQTKVMAPNELDALCIQKHILHDMFHVPTSPFNTTRKESIELFCKDEYENHLVRVLDDKKRLSSAKLLGFYSRACIQQPNPRVILHPRVQPPT